MTRRAGLDSRTVLLAAAELADEQGLDALSLTTLADRLGVRPPSIYNHVAGLPGIHRELALMGVRELGARMANAAVGKSRDEAIIAVAAAYRAFVHEHPGLYAAGVRADPTDAELGAASAEPVGVVVRVLAGYGLEGDEVIHAVRGLRSLIHGFASLEIEGGFGLPLDLDESFARMLRYFIDGLEKAEKVKREA